MGYSLIAPLFLLSACSFALIAHLAATRPEPPAMPRVVDLGPIDGSLTGGVLWRIWGIPWRVTIPMARLQVGANGIRVGPNGPGLGRIVPTWQWRWAELESAQARSTKIRICPKNEASLDFLVFRSADRERLVGLMDMRIPKGLQR